MSCRELKQNKRVLEETLQQARDLCKKINHLLPEMNLPFSNQERIQIVQAMQLARGAWYKCPNGECRQYFKVFTLRKKMA